MSRLVRFIGAGFALSIVVIGFGVAAAPALGRGPWMRPVDGGVVRGFDPPDSMFGPGHLGVDFAAAPGTAVRAAGDGVVVFAGRVGAALHVVTRHPGDIRTSDSFLASISVVAGQAVGRGSVLGTTGGTGAGHGAGVLHFGVRVGGAYVDPMLLFAAPDLAAVVHLAEPRRGAATEPSTSSAAPERAALAAEMRVDGRSLPAPPTWWDDPPVAAGPDVGVRPAPAAAVVPRDRPRPPGPARGATGELSAVVGVSAAGVLGAAAATRRRRRRGQSRGETPPTTLHPGPAAPGLRNLARRPVGAAPKPH